MVEDTLSIYEVQYPLIIRGLLLAVGHARLKNTSFYYFKYDIPHKRDNLATLGAVFKHRVIQVNRLSQVLAHRDKFRSFRTETPAIVLKIALYQRHT